ncbi:PREDICTED: WD repeat-containing protein 63-like [Eufriesea mexicana]|uniref:WD repeat-containing protein 63-like n=1 Tax=Eufriesea mexicana TaxID=516756 RepID=UPI00083BF8F2|nr:PREDICTED: WD repeat-containing protein 63-like [Eufriesea mexicana]
MPRKGVKHPYGWTLVDENIENVERVKLDPETQRELGCLVGEHVFLEYPWAYVHRDVVAKFAKLPDSSLAVFREKIEAYETDAFLVGYSSVRLSSDEFVICLTDEAKQHVEQRNKDIGAIVWRKVVAKVVKAARLWNTLGSDSEVDESFVKNTRAFFEIEIVLPGRVLNSARTLCDRGANDARDSYMELVNEDEEEFKNVDRRCISRSVQTNLPPRETFVQTYPEYPKNAWTQYVYEDILKEVCTIEDIDDEEQPKEESERNDDDRSPGKETIRSKENDEEPRGKTPLELFLEARSQEMIDVVKYNAAVNLYVDDIESLSGQKDEIATISEVPTFYEQVSFVDLELTASKAVSHVSLHPRLTEYLAISYIAVSNRTWRSECTSEGEFQIRALLWKLNDPLRPQLAFADHREIYSVCFCPYDDNLVIGGCSTGQVIIWNTRDYLNNRHDKNTKLGTSARNNLPVLRPIIVSDKHRSHRLPVRKIRWISAKYRTEPNGNLTKSFISSDVEFLTVSEDGTVAVWNVPLRSEFLVIGHDAEDSGEPFRPIFRLKIPTLSEDSRDFTPLCLCLPSVNVLDEHEKTSDTDEYDPKEKNSTKSAWIGCAEGLIKCTWDDKQAHEEKHTADIVECDILNCSHVHDGPVTEIVRSSHLQEILLTIGGQVFAIWNDDHTDSPLFWRRTSSRYTSCCWANEPGVFLLGNDEGSLEMWNVKGESNQPIFTQVVSLKSITYLIQLQSCVFGNEGSKMIGIGDRGGWFRAFKEPEIFRGDVATERMDWFEEYAWREARRKKLFTSWQNNFLANDPVVVAKRSARRDEGHKREAKEAREMLRREQEARLRLQAEKRARSAPVPKHVAWMSKEFDRMKDVLLNKKNLIPSEIEAKRLAFVALKAERDVKLGKVNDKIARRDEYLLNALSRKFPKLLEPRVKASEFEEFIPIDLGKSVDDYAKKFAEIRRKANELLANNSTS